MKLTEMNSQMKNELFFCIALGETNEAFYKNLYTGQQLPMPQRQTPVLRPHRPAPVPNPVSNVHNITINQTNPSPTVMTTSTTTSQPVPPPPPYVNNPNVNCDQTTENCGWTCNLCTFQNKYTQRTCEACTMPFLSAGNIDYNGQLMLSLPMQPQSNAHYMPMQSMPIPQQHNNNNNIPVHYLIYKPATIVQANPSSSSQP